jgi:hypothetical protein
MSETPRSPQDALAAVDAALIPIEDILIAMAANTATGSNRLQCGNRPCKEFATGKRKHSAFCSPACRVHVHRHPEDDARKERLCLVKRGKKRDPYQEAQKEQTQKVLAMLEKAPGGVTTADFLGAYIGRFGARVAELRAVGHDIRMKKTGDHGAIYRLVKE